MNTQIIAIANQKGGVGKTTTCANLGVGLAQAGKKVLLIDGDPQGSLTISLDHPQPDKLPFTLSDAMGRILMDEPIKPGEGILHHPEGVDLMPADIQLSGMEVSLVNAMSRETILRQYLDTLKGQYSHILIDCQPSLGMLTVNALAAANRIIIPVQAEYLPAKGLEQLLQTVNKVKRQINPKLQIDGILLTMVDNRTNFAKEIAALLRETYGSKITVFKSEIPHSVRAKEISAEGKSIFAHDPIAEHQRNAAVEQGHKSHGDNLFSQLSHMASLAEHHQVDKKVDNDTHDHAGQHAQVYRDPPPVQTFCHYIAAKGCDRSLGKIGRGGCPKNNGYRERRQRRHAYTQQRSANRRQKCGKHECAPPFSLCGES